MHADSAFLNLRSSRSYYFIMNNGHSAMFDGFRKALDAMMVFSYERLNKVKIGEGKRSPRPS